MLFYLASPYTKYVHGHEDAFYRVKLVTAALLRHQIAVWAPIVYSHQFCLDGLPVEAEHWMFLDEEMVKVCDGCIVYMMQGWDESDGVRHELDLFNKARKPVEYLGESVPINDYAEYLKSSFVLIES